MMEKEAAANCVRRISVHNLDFYYGRAKALKNIGLPATITPSPRSSALQVAANLLCLRVFNRMYALYPDQHAEGEVLLDGENILSPDVDLNLLRSRVGMVFQKPTPFPTTIYENIALGIRLLEKLPKPEIDERVEAALRKAALWPEVKDNLQASGLSLSGGQQQRLCIARTVALRPDVIPNPVD